MTILHNIAALSLRAAFVGAFAVSAPAAVLAQTPAQDARLDAAVSALRAIGTMKADFAQTDRNGNTLTGELTLKRPGKIRFQYQDDAKLLVVSTGKSLYLVDYAVKQVERWPIKNSPLGALLDPNRDVAKFGKVNPTNNSDVISVEVHDPKRPEYGRITLIFIRKASAPGGWELTSWVALDSQNQRTTVRLSNQRYGMAVGDSAFSFDDPRRTSRRPR